MQQSPGDRRAMQGRHRRGTSSLLLIGLSCICRPEGRNDAETEELADGYPGLGAAGGPLRDPVVARRRLQQRVQGEERAPSSQASAWSWSSTRIDEEGSIGRTWRRPKNP